MPYFVARYKGTVMLRTLFLLAICAFSNSAFSTPIKLSCRVDVTYLYPSGSTEKEHGKIILTVDTSDNVTLIIGTGAGLDISVANSRIGPITEAQDSSDEGKWDMSNKIPANDGKYYTTHIVIDRNTGDLVFSRIKDGGIDTEVTGTCDKVRTAIRKF